MEIVMTVFYVLFALIILGLGIQTIKYFFLMWKYKSTPKEKRKDDFFYFD